MSNRSPRAAHRIRSRRVARRIRTLRLRRQHLARLARWEASQMPPLIEIDVDRLVHQYEITQARAPWWRRFFSS